MKPPVVCTELPTRPAPPTRTERFWPTATAKSPSIVAPNPPTAPFAPPPCAPAATICSELTHDGTANVWIVPVGLNVIVPWLLLTCVQPITASHASVVHASASSQATSAWAPVPMSHVSVVQAFVLLFVFVLLWFVLV